MIKINEKKFSDLVNEYTLLLYKRANYLLSNATEAEDIVQDVFISAFQSYEKYKGNSSIKTWLLGILQHKVADYYRKKYKNITSISLDHYFDQDGSWRKEHIQENWSDDDDSIFNDKDFRKEFDKCLDKLPNKWSLPFKLYYLENKKSELISQEFGLSTTNIWKILQRGRLQLKECLEINWFKKD